MTRVSHLAIALVAVWGGPALGQTCEDRSDDYAARIALCDQAFEAAQDDAASALALAMKGETQRMMGDYAAAAETLNYALRFAPEDIWIWVELGNVRFNQGDAPGAIGHYSAALSLGEDAAAFAYRADGWWELNNPQRCSDDADQALRLAPQYAFANEIKGRCLVELGQPEQAIAYLDDAISFSPDYMNSYRYKMTALLDLGRYEEAVAVADKALDPRTGGKASPEEEEQILALRLIALHVYAPPETVMAEADALLARYPENFYVINTKAMILITEERFSEADSTSQILRRKTEERGLDGATYDTLAQIDIALGRLDLGYANFETALAKDPRLSKIYAKELSELGFLPLSNAPDSVLTALRRCIDLKKQACSVGG
jgi:tetratricopeptide (TPR) repeat protein